MSRFEHLRRLGCLLALFVICQTAMAAPKAVVDKERINLGSIKQGTVAESAITIRNDGDEPLEIGRISISCPCTSVDIPGSNIVEPGGSATLPVHYDSKDKAGETGATISIALNDPARPFAIVDLEVEVKTPFFTNPDQVYETGLTPRGHECRKTLMIAAGEKNADLEIVDLQFEHPTITAKWEKKVVKDYARVTLTFALTPDAPLGDYSNRLIAKLRVGGEETDLRMPVKGFVVGDVVVLPPAIHDPIKAYLQGEHISEITVYPSVNNTVCPKVLGVLAVGPLKASIMPNPPENKYVISVDTADNAAGGPRSGTIYVMTASKDQPIVGIPVYFKVAKALDVKPENLVFTMAGNAGASGGNTQTQWVSTSVWYKPWTWGTGNNVATQGNVLAQRMKIENPQGKPFTIKQVRCEEDLFGAAIIKASSGGVADPAEVEIVPTGVIDPARAASMAILVTDCPGAEEFFVPVLLQP